MAPEREDVLRQVDQGRRQFLRQVIAGAAFAPPLVMSFSMEGLSVGTAEAVPPAPNQCSNQTTSCSNMTSVSTVTFFLDRDGGELTLTTTKPTGAVAKFTDSPSLSRSNGNPWREIGTWTTDTDICRAILDVDELEVWVGLVNSDDQGTAFDLRAQLVVGELLIAEGEALCVQGVTRNAAKAKSVLIDLEPTENCGLLEGDVELTVLARIATGCPGHASARGLRLYYGSAARDSGFSLDVSQRIVLPPPG